jgi:hypothetical protein
MTRPCRLFTQLRRIRSIKYIRSARNPLPGTCGIGPLSLLIASNMSSSLLGQRRYTVVLATPARAATASMFTAA